MSRQSALMARILIVLAVAALSVAFAVAQAKPAPEKVVNMVTLSQVRSVLGEAGEDNSGVSDFSQGGDGEVIIAYRYYDVDKANYETDFASEITPRIQTMFIKFKNFDRVRFQIVTNNPSAPPLWIPFSEFVIDRKTVEDLHYTWFVARYILDQTLKHKR